MRRTDQRGMTVVELAVGVMLVGIVGAVLLSFLDSTTSVTARATSHVQAERDGQLAMRTMSQDVRGANPIISTYPTAPTSCPSSGSYPGSYPTCLRVVVVHATAAGATCTGPGGFVVQAPFSAVTYAKVGSQVLRDKVDYSSTCTVTAATRGRVVMEDLDTASSTPLFTMLDRTGVATTEPANASSIRIQMDVRYKSDAPPLQLSSTVALRNNR